MANGLSFVAIMACCASLCVLTGQVAAGESVRTADGRDVTGKLTALDEKGALVERDGTKQLVSLSDIVRITWADATGEDLLLRKGQAVAFLRDGSCLAVGDVTVSGGKLNAVSALAGPMSFPLDRVSRVLRPSSTETPEQLERELRQLGTLGGKEDALVVRATTGKWVPMNGILGSLTNSQVLFTYEGTETTMKDEQIAILVFAGVGPGEAKAGVGGHVLGTDGSKLAFRSIAATGTEVIVDNALVGQLKLRREGLAEVRLWREGTTFLSDLTPTEVQQTPFFDDECPWQKDRSAGGHPLVLDGKTYEKGLGLHAKCKLVFDLRGEFARLSGLAGIAGELRSGRAQLTLLPEGKVLADAIPLDRCKSLQKIDLDVRGARSLTILVDFAEKTFGSGACVNLCDLVLTK